MDRTCSILILSDRLTNSHHCKHSRQGRRLFCNTRRSPAEEICNQYTLHIGRRRDVKARLLEIIVDLTANLNFVTWFRHSSLYVVKVSAHRTKLDVVITVMTITVTLNLVRVVIRKLAVLWDTGRLAGRVNRAFLAFPDPAVQVFSKSYSGHFVGGE